MEEPFKEAVVGSAHFKLVGIGLANVASMLIWVNFFQWNWVGLSFISAIFTYCLCFPTRTWRGFKYLGLKGLPEFWGRLVKLFSSWERSLSTVAYGLVFLVSIFEAFLLVGLWAMANPKTASYFGKSPNTWYEALIWSAVLGGHIGVLILELRAKVGSKHSLTHLVRWVNLSKSSDTVWSLWVIALCLPILGQILSSFILVPYVFGLLILLAEGIALSIGYLFATVYVAWNRSEVLVCLGDGFISATLTSVFVVKDFQGWVLVLLSFLIGYGIGVIHFYLFRPLVTTLEPYKLRF